MNTFCGCNAKLDAPSCYWLLCKEKASFRHGGGGGWGGRGVGVGRMLVRVNCVITCIVYYYIRTPTCRFESSTSAIRADLFS